MPNIFVGQTSADAPTNVAVDQASTTIIAQDTTRSGLVLVNISDSTVYLGLGGNAAVLKKGVTLTPKGGTWTMDDYTFNNEAVTGISHSTGSIVSIQQFVKR